MSRSLLVSALLAASAFAQAPVFEAARVQIPNSSDTTPLGPGDLISVYGSYLGPTQACQGREDPKQQETPNPRRSLRQGNNLRVFPKELCGVRVLVGSEPAGLLYVHSDQINFKVPQTVPMEGTVGLQIIHGNQASAVVQIEAGLAPLRLILPEHAFTDMPIWVGVTIPPNRAWDIRYPYPLGPPHIGCNELLVRKGGRLIDRNPFNHYRGHIFAGQICGSSSLGDRYQNRLPLHLLYRFDEPGDYEVRLQMGYASAPGEVLTEEQIAIQSEWTPLRVDAAPPDQRRDWLTELTRDPPAAPEDLIADYLPSILGVPDEQSLQAVITQLYHLHPRVAQFAAQGLGYWTKPQIALALEDALKQRGPSEALVESLELLRGENANPADIIEVSLPDLRSNDPVRLRGALRALRSINALEVSTAREALSAKAASLLIGAERTVIASGDPDSQWQYADRLGVFGGVNAAPILWRFVDEGIAFGASLRSLAAIARPEDLPRLASFIGVKHMPRDYYHQTNSLLGTLTTAYGADALPFVKSIIQQTDSDTLRDDAGRALVYYDLPGAWAFIAEAIESDAPYKADVMRHARARYPNWNATQASMLTLAKRLAVGQEP